MFTCRRIAVLTLFALAFSLSVPWGTGGSIAVAAEREEAPEFKRSAAAKSFESGQKKFKKRDYRGARSDFKKARSSGKGRKDKAIVDGWIKATEGGEQLTRVRRFLMKANYREAYDGLTGVYTKYLGTPIASEFEKEWKKLATRATTVLEGFDSHSKYYVQKPSRVFVEGEDKVLRGTHSLGWKSSPDNKPTAVTLRRVPENWSGFDTVELWYNARIAPIDMHLVLTCGRRGNDDTKDTREHKLTTHIRMKGKGWHCLRLPLDDFESSGLPCLTKVKKVELIVAGKRRFDFMLDNISIVKNASEM